MIYVAVVGPGEEASAEDVAAAREVGVLLGARGWVTLTGGRAAGVMNAAAEGAGEGGGVSIGILPDHDRSRAAFALTAAIATGLGEARNVVLVTAADAVIACGMSAGTLSEVALAARAGRPVVILGRGAETVASLTALAAGSISIASSAEEAVQAIAIRLTVPNP